MNHNVLLLVPLILCFHLTTRATHTSGGELYYVWQNDSTYEVTVMFFRHCTGFTAGAPTTISLIVSSDSLNQTQTVVLPRLAITGSSVPPLLPTNVYNCFPNATLCVEEFAYRGDVVLQARTRDWKLSYEVCCRPVEVDNLANGTSTTFRIEAGINNLDFQDSVHQNTSPIWHTRRPNVPGHLSDTLFNYPVWNVCEWKDYSINQSAFEYQGDSVVYELVDFHQDSFLVNGSLLTYSAPYADTFVIPFDTSKPLFIDPNTGIVSYSPVTPPNLSSTGNLKLFQFAIKATEYRYDSFLVSGNMVWEARPMGYLIRNIQTITTDSSLCPEPNPFGSASSQSISDLNCNDSLIEFDLKKNIICASMDADASCFHMIDTITNDTIALDSAWIQDCFRSGEGYKVRIRPVMPLPYGVYWLTFKVGNDSNTAISSCQVGIKPYNDTLILVLDSIPTGVMLGDYIFGTTYDNKVTLICRSTKFLINLSEEVNCSSISGNFSDFLLVNNSVSPPDSVPISLISPLGCNDNSTSQIEVTSSNPFNPGLYTLYLIKGSDGNTLLTNCGEEWPLMSIPIQVEGFSISLGPDRVFCLGQTVAALLTAPSGFSSYKWSTGSSSRNLWVYSPGTYWVEVVDFDGCPGTDTIQVKQISCVGIESSSIDGFNVYPNPFHDQIFVSHGTIKTADIEILTIYGKLLLQHNNFPMGEGLEIGHYPAGIYFLKVTNGSEVILKKLVKE